MKDVKTIHNEPIGRNNTPSDPFFGCDPDPTPTWLLGLTLVLAALAAAYFAIETSTTRLTRWWRGS